MTAHEGLTIYLYPVGKHAIYRFADPVKDPKMNSQPRHLRASAGTTVTLQAILPIMGGLLLAACESADSNLFSSAVADEPAWEKSIAARAGFIAFETFGRDDSIAHVEALPYLEADQHTVFSDIRFFVSDDGLFGGNAGFGYRYRLLDSDRFIGGSLWYDLDDTTGQLFHQIGLSLETYGSNWDFRTNFYLPVGKNEHEYGIAVINQRFVDNQIVYDGSRTFGEAMEGVDLEFGAPFPTQFAARHRITANVGGYWFLGDVAPDIQGVKCRVEGNLTDHVAMQVEMTHDDTFDTNVMLGIAVEFPGGSRHDDSDIQPFWRRANEFSRRNYNIIVSRQEDLQTGLTAMQSSTGQPYSVQHVSSTAGGLNLGTVDDPFATIAEAQAADGDLVFVHADSVLADAIVTASGETILGEGVEHMITYGEYGSYLLPTATDGTLRPTLQGAPGTAVTLASNATLSGFVVDSPSGHGMMGNAVENVTVTNVDVVDATQDGIFLQHLSGSNTFANVNISGAAGSALYIDGGTADLALEGVIENSAGRALVVQNTTSGEIDLSNATLNDDGGEGVLLNNVKGSVSLGEVDIRNSSVAGISVQDSTGAFTFDEVRIENSALAGVDVQNVSGSIEFGSVAVDGMAGSPGLSIVDSSATSSIGSLDLTVQNATALQLRNTGTVTISDGTIASSGGSAVDIENTETEINLTSVSSDGAGVGIRIVDNPGTFQVNGDGNLGSGGLIQNATAGVLLRDAGTVALKYMDIDGNDSGIDSANTEHFGLAYSRVANSLGYGIDSLNATTFEIMESVFENNGGPTDNTIRAHVDADGSYEYVIHTSTFDDDSAAAVSIFSSGAGDGASMTFLFQENHVTTARFGADGVNLNWNGPLFTTLKNNVIQGIGGSNDGFDIVASSTVDAATIGIYNNDFTFDDGGETGTRITTLGPALVVVESNNITFDAADGVGVDFTLAKSAEVYLYANLITDNVAGGTGIQFTSIEGPAEVNINSNQIDLLSATDAIDYGIRFISITDTIDLVGHYNNIVNGATTSFFAPVGTTTGKIYVNGAGMP